MDFKEFLTLLEGITSSDDGVSFDYGSNDGASTKLGKGKKFKPFKRTGERVVVVHSVYNVKDATDTLKAVKALGRNPTEEYRRFVGRSAIFLANRIIGPLGIDTVITPESSSRLIRDTVDALRTIVPHVEFVTDRFRKLDPSAIRIAKDDPRITPEIIRTLERVIDNAARDGYFQMKKVQNKDRKFLSNFFELVDGYRYEKLSDRNVAVLDDLVGSGTSFDSMAMMLEKYNPKSIVGMSLFKTS